VLDSIFIEYEQAGNGDTVDAYGTKHRILQEVGVSVSLQVQVCRSLCGISDRHGSSVLISQMFDGQQ
jgi:hypothetical protein